MHVSVAMRAFIDAHFDWLTVFRLPAYAPDLNAAEGVWSHLNHRLRNCAATGIDRLAAIVTHLKRIQYRPELLDGFLPRPDSPSSRPRPDRRGARWLPGS